MKKVKNNRGAAMIAALCIMAIFVTFCLAMLLASSVLINTAQRKGFEEQCRISAVTMSEELEQALGDESSGFFGYIKQNMQTTGTNTAWPYYNTDELGHGESFNVYKNLSMSGESTGTGDITAKLYWEWESGAELSEIYLHVEVTASKSGENHTIHTIYTPSVNESGTITSWSFSERY